MRLELFKQLWDLQAGPEKTRNYDLDVILKHRKNRFQHSIENNPQFFYAPFSGIIASQAGFTFIYRFMANKSAEHPEYV